jgi:hypothetical protein
MYKQIISVLVRENKDDKIILDFLNDSLNLFANFVRISAEADNCVNILRHRLDPQDYRERLGCLRTNLDITKGSIKISIRIMNDLCKKANMEEIFANYFDDDKELIDFIKLVVDELFEDFHENKKEIS